MMLLGFRPGVDHNADAAFAIQCAWDMGYRRADSLADMARKMLEKATEAKED